MLVGVIVNGTWTTDVEGPNVIVTALLSVGALPVGSGASVHGWSGSVNRAVMFVIGSTSWLLNAGSVSGTLLGGGVVRTSGASVSGPTVVEPRACETSCSPSFERIAVVQDDANGPVGREHLVRAQVAVVVDDEHEGVRADEHVGAREARVALRAREAQAREGAVDVDGLGLASAVDTHFCSGYWAVGRRPRRRSCRR
jgi:hypothetical protein